ncbi:MAG: competence/damage-inducible protein A [Syntrophomonadaceae bacterium]|jgi:nicotinamide-nucleotide amidase|nr:competence/damage-inducible protein A [Syntrophomonadaceae bacterium]
MCYKRARFTMEFFIELKVCEHIKGQCQKVLIKELLKIKKAYIISTGTEITSGAIVDTNGAFLARNLTEEGFKVIGCSVVGDDKDYMHKLFVKTLQEADLIVASGGLGPTLDDVTKHALCQALDMELVLDEKEEEKIKRYFQKRERSMPDINIRQAMFPAGAQLLDNNFGTASGMYLLLPEQMVVLLPGPPRELKPMFEQELLPVLRKKFNLQEKKIIRRTVKVFGPGESQVETMLQPLIATAKGYSFAFLADEGEVHIKINLEEEFIAQGDVLLNKAVSDIEDIMGDSVFGYEEDTLISRVSFLLKEKRMMLSVAESCTGGLLAKMLTDHAGSSDFFWGSLVVYNNDAKKKLLGVNEKTLLEKGAVSEEVAEEMAVNIRQSAGTDIALSVTGIAGPGGAAAGKSVGLVFIGCADDEGCLVKKMNFSANRDFNRLFSAKTALDILRRRLEHKA